MGRKWRSCHRTADIVLLEDGKPREVTIFDSPATQGRMPLELVLLFDTNPKIEYFWDPAAVYRFIPQWNEEMSRAILEKGTADVRISVYRCAGRRLYPLCPATTDAQQLLKSFRGLLKPAASRTAIALNLPPKRDRVHPGRFTDDYVTSPFVSRSGGVGHRRPPFC